MSIPLSNIVAVGITISPTPTPLRGFGKLLFVTDAEPTDETFTLEERVRTYPNLDAVLEDWDVSSEVYKAAVPYFTPRATNFMVGRASATETAASLTGGPAGALVDLQAITAGGFTITIDGTAYQLAGIDLSGAADLDEVALEVEQVLQGLGASTASIDVVGGVFVVTSGTVGAGSEVSFAAADIGGLALELGLTEPAGATQTLAQVAETPADALAVITNINPTYYGIVLDRQWRDNLSVIIGVADFAQGSQRVFFNTTNDSASLTTATGDILTALKAGNYSRTLSNYSSEEHADEYPSAAVAGRAFIVNFEGVNTTITLFLKTLPGISTETLTLTQKQNLEAKNGNAVVEIGGNNVYSDSRMADGTWFDTIHGIDWLQNRIETDVFNRLYTTTTKVPYSDTGVSMIYQALEGALRQAITNGLGAPGTTAEGEYLPLGYSISYVPVSQVSQADKGNRHYAGMSFKLVGAGALHSITISGQFNE
jgi:hypothetical protein